MNKQEFEIRINKQIKKGEKILSDLKSNIPKPTPVNVITLSTKYRIIKEEYENWDDFNLTLIKTSLKNEEYAKNYEGAIVFEFDKRKYNQINYKKLISEISKKIQNLTQLKNKIELFQENEFKTSVNTASNEKNMKRIFISHSSLDEKIVEKFIKVLETIGLTHNEVFCSSIGGYGVKLGKDFIETIKRELSTDSVVVSVLSDNYYNSPISLCEMGAAWIKSNEFIPIIIPPFKFENIKGVFPNSITGFKINDKYALTDFKELLEEKFDLKSINASRWEEKRDDIIKEMNDLINKKTTNR